MLGFDPQKEDLVTGLKHVCSLILAASMIVASAYSEAATIRYDVTNATSVQNGYSLSGYIEVSGTGTISDYSLLSFNLTATKADDPTLTFVSGNGAVIVSSLIATDSALYVPDGSTLQITETGRYIDWANNYSGSSFYRGGSGFGLNPAWDSGSYPNTGVNGWQIGSAQAAPSSVPEIDPNSLGSVLALVLGSLGLLERRRLKAA
jgi:hypothetical protein